MMTRNHEVRAHKRSARAGAVSGADRALREEAARHRAPARVPFSGGPKAALSSRGAESAERTLKRVWTAIRR